MGDDMTFHRAAVPVPEMGPEANIRFDWAACQAMDDYFDGIRFDIPRRLAAADTAALRHVLTHALKGAEVEETLEAVPFITLSERVVEAIDLMWYGPEKVAIRREIEKAFEYVERHPKHWLWPLAEAFYSGFPQTVEKALGLALVSAKDNPATGNTVFDDLAERIDEAIGTHTHKTKWGKVKREANHA
jgi:hypothetical protein